MKEAIDIMRAITINLDTLYTHKVIEREVKPLVDMLNSMSDNYTVSYLSYAFDNESLDRVRVELDVRGIIEYTDDADYINKVYDLSDMLTLEREDIKSEIYKFHDITKLKFEKDAFYIINIGFGSSSKPLREYE